MRKCVQFRLTPQDLVFNPLNILEHPNTAWNPRIRIEFFLELFCISLAALMKPPELLWSTRKSHHAFFFYNFPKTLLKIALKVPLNVGLWNPLRRLETSLEYLWSSFETLMKLSLKSLDSTETPENSSGTLYNVLQSYWNLMKPMIRHITAMIRHSTVIHLKYWHTHVIIFQYPNFS